MEHVSYKGGCGMHVSRHLKEELIWAIERWFSFISNVMLLVTISVQ